MSDSRISWLTPPVAILIGAVLIAGSILYIGGSRAPSDGTANIAQPTPDRIEDFAALATADDPVLGDPDAPVTIVEFSDFQCPFCRSWWLETFPQLKREYLDTGKAKLVFRDFPLPFHSAAIPSAVGARCAQEQGKFWEFHDELFAQQMQKEADPTRVAVTISYGEDDIRSWARAAGVDGTAFDACLAAAAYAANVQEDLQAGQDAAVDGTPTFFVNGLRIVGAQPYNVFQQAIEAELQ
jgi:protein-disulfide isomerase